MANGAMPPTFVAVFAFVAVLAQSAGAPPYAPYFSPRSTRPRLRAQILAELGVRHMRLLTNHHVSRTGLGVYGLEVVETLPLPA